MKISEIKKENLKKQISLISIKIAVDDTITACIGENYEIDYFKLELFSALNLLTIASDGYDIVQLDGADDYIGTYDEIMEHDLIRLVNANCKCADTFNKILSSEIAKIEKLWQNTGILEGEFIKTMGKLTDTIEKVTDDKYVTKVIKAFGKNVAQEKIDSVANVAKQLIEKLPKINKEG